jgi:hypothetical protein
MVAELGWTPVRLPSRGALNLHPETGVSLIPDGEVSIRKLTTQEESILLSQGAQGLERLDIIIKNCVKIPGGVKHNDLLITDRMALVLYLRTTTFGPNYSFTYKCQYCGQMSKCNLNILQDLDERTPESIGREMLKQGKVDHAEDFKLAEPIRVHLPDCNKDVALRFLRGEDEKKIASRSKRMMLQSNDASDPSYIYRIALQIVEINGEKKPVVDCEAFVRGLTALDNAHIRIMVDDMEPGIDLSVFPECRSCGAASELTLPFSAEFFRPSHV